MENNGWHLRKDVTVGNLIATAVLAMSIIGAAITFDRRVTVLEQRQTYATERFDRQTQAFQRSLDQVNDRLQRIELLLIDVLKDKTRTAP